jgi:hypothetical protein
MTRRARAGSVRRRAVAAVVVREHYASGRVPCGSYRAGDRHSITGQTATVKAPQCAR